MSTCERDTPDSTIIIPKILFIVNISFNIKKEKIAVIIGIRLVKILALLTPKFLITYTQHIKAKEDAKIDSCNNEPTKRTVG